MSNTELPEAGTSSSTPFLHPRANPATNLPLTTRHQPFISLVHWASYHIYTIWLFTFSDIKTIVAPQTIFAILTALSPIAKKYAASLNQEQQDYEITTELRGVLPRAPLIVFWIWVTLLPFNISHQRQPGSLQEDAINKPWRPLATRRWSPTTARNAMIVFYAASIVASCTTCGGGLRSSLALIVLGYWYNDCGGGDKNPIVRNLLNALGVSSFSVGALEVSLQQELRFSLEFIELRWTPSLESWFIILTVILFSTIQFQDMGDTEGDLARGRRTFPLQYGKSPTRWANGIIVLCWTIFCPLFWQSGVLGYLSVVPPGAYVAYRAVTLRTPDEDNNTYKIYNAWLALLYLLPLLKHLD